MEDLLYTKYLHESIEGKKARPTNLDDKKWTQLNQKVENTIRP